MFSIQQLPNILTGTRILMVPPLIWLINTDQSGFALVLLFLAALTDYADGLLAKRYNWISRIGSILDPVADKLMLVSVFTTLCLKGYVPLWLWLLVMIRDFIIVAGATCFHFYVKKLDADPSRISKINTLIQIVFLLFILVANWQLTLESWLTAYQILLVVVAVSTGVSGVHYVTNYGYKAFTLIRGQKND